MRRLLSLTLALLLALAAALPLGAFAEEAAGTPMTVSAATWSFSSEISGETTRVAPDSINAGRW